MIQRLSVVIPALNEARDIVTCVRSVLAQEVDAEIELLVVDGRSSDGTAELARKAGATVVESPRPGIGAALNVGLSSATGEVVVRFDAHAEMPPGYLAACLLALEEEDAASVGGWREARGSGPWGLALRAALESRLGVGHPLIWHRPNPSDRRRDVEHVPLGCFRADVIRGVGGWREDLDANEDFELDHRLRKAGGRIVFDPRIWSVYRPRESLEAIARQYWRYGRGKAVVLADAPESLRPRQVAPPALVVAVALAALPTQLGPWAKRALVLYAAAIGVAAARSSGGWRTAPVLVTMHAAWGAGLLLGLARRSHTGNRALSQA
jgi:succinoglycan biosynthesis protein ExoA